MASTSSGALEQAALAREKCGRRVQRSRYNGCVEKVARIFDSFAEADEAEALLDAQLTPDERLRIAIQLRDLRHPDAAQQGLARVCRVVELEQS